NEIRILQCSAGNSSTVSTGTQVPLRVLVDLAGLNPGDVQVEAVGGRGDGEGKVAGIEGLTLPSIEKQGNAFLFGKDYAPATTGRLGFSARLSPNHNNDPLTRPCNTLFKWAGSQ